MRHYDLSSINTWAKLWQQHHHSDICETHISAWPSKAVNPMVDTYKCLINEYDKEFQLAISESNMLLSPFGEPLCLNFGLNRWLNGEREEAYSDWLAWLFESLSVEEILEVLSIVDTEFVNSIKWQPIKSKKIIREFTVDKGNDEASGRLDIFIIFDNVAAIVVELKKGAASSSDTYKQQGYFKSILERKIPFYPLLMVTESSDKIIDNFYVLEYQEFCISLRRFVLDRKLDCRGVVYLSFILALAATIESNFLGLSTVYSRFNVKTQQYLKQFIGGYNVGNCKDNT
jgi:hypothetical protein